MGAQPPVFRDGFGPRWLSFDPETSDPIEVLSFEPRFVDAPGFAEALGERAARLASARHAHYAKVRRVERPAADSLRLVSDRVDGWRLSQVLLAAQAGALTPDISAIVALLRQLVPAVALFARHQREFAVGVIGPERLVLTPQSRLLIAEYTLGPAVDALQLSRERYWRDLRVALPPTGERVRVTPAADVVGIGVVTLSLLLGRLLRDDEFPEDLPDLIASVNESSGGSRRPLSEGFTKWLSRTLHLDPRLGYQTPQEAQVGFEEMLARERAYVTTPALLDAWVARYAAVGGQPVQPRPGAPDPTQNTTTVVAPGVTPSRPAATTTATAWQVKPSVKPPLPPPLASPAPPPGGPSPVAAEAAAAPERASVRSRHPGLFAAVLVIAVIQAIALVWLWTARGEVLGDEGEIVIQSRPSAARVIIDGHERGVTPLSLRLSAGAHVVQVQAGNSEPRVIPVQIRAGVQTAQYVELQNVPTVGALDVRSDPPRARVSIDGQYKGETPLVLRDLPAGEHEIVVELRGRQVREIVRVRPGVTQQIQIPVR